MRRVLATVTIVAIGVLTVGAGMALAAELDIVPAEPEVGLAELTIDVSDFAPDTAIYAIPCQTPAEGEELDLGTSACDIAAVEVAVTDGDGKATFVVNWDIPDDGITVYVGDEARDHEATHVLTPSVPDDESTDPDVEVLGTNVVQEEDLADTGPREVMLAAMIGTLLIGVGMALRGAERWQTVKA
ncbi:MAG: hypothetical protein DHS20C19_07070 [Acidimicrobiales bacterium]|nr:MAG: hypothetical protein DHS20C19_07070 [Acidimicrobiales bacterium]